MSQKSFGALGVSLPPWARTARPRRVNRSPLMLDPTLNTYGDQPPNIFAPGASPPPPPPRRSPPTRRPPRRRRRGRGGASAAVARAAAAPIAAGAAAAAPRERLAKNRKRDDDDDAAPRPPIAPPPKRAPPGGAPPRRSFGGGPPVGGYPFGSAAHSFPHPPSHSITGSGDAARMRAPRARQRRAGVVAAGVGGVGAPFRRLVGAVVRRAVQRERRGVRRVQIVQLVAVRVGDELLGDEGT